VTNRERGTRGFEVISPVVLGYLAKYCQGAEHARPIARIAADLAVLGIACDARAVRDAAADLSATGFPVGTTCGPQPGVFLCVTGRDFGRAYRNLCSRLRVQARRARAFKAAAREVLSGQRRFDFSEAAARLEAIEAAPLLAALEGNADASGCIQAGVFGQSEVSPDGGQETAAGAGSGLFIGTSGGSRRPVGLPSSTPMR